MNKIFIKLVESGESYKEKYQINKPNNEDSGFDLFCPDELKVPPKAISFKVDIKIQTRFEDSDNKNVGYMLVPRSSMGAKTPLRLCNSIGIIDSSYRGNLMMFVDNVSDKEYIIEKGDRLGQVVSFNGNPILSQVVDVLDDTIRGDKGFGSSGR